MKTDSQLIKRAIVVNAILLVYFCTSNLSSFFGIILGVGLFATAGFTNFLHKKSEGEIKPDEWIFSKDFVQKKYNEFFNASLAKRTFLLIQKYRL